MPQEAAARSRVRSVTIISAVVEFALQLFAAVAWTLAYRAFTGAATTPAAAPPYQPPLPAA